MDSLSAPAPRDIARRVAADAAGGLVVTLIIGLVVASLTTAGIITMAVALLFLALAFVVAMASTFLLDHLWRPTWKQRGVVAVILLFVLGGIGSYEWTNYIPPLTRAEVAEELIKRFPAPPSQESPKQNLPVTSVDPIEAPPPFPGPLQSRIDKWVFACNVAHSAPVTQQRYAQDVQRFQNTIGALGDAFGIETGVSGIRGGFRIDMEAKTVDAKKRFANFLGIYKTAVEVRRVGERVIVTWTMFLPADSSLLGRMEPERDSVDAIHLLRNTEALLAEAHAKCTLI